MVLWCPRFPPKNEQKQVNLRYHSSKVEFLRSFFWGNRRHQNPFRNYVTFTIFNIFNWNYRLADDSESVMIQIVWLDKKFYRILQSWLHKECTLFCTVWQLGIKVNIHKLRGEQFSWNRIWNSGWFWAGWLYLLKNAQPNLFIISYFWGQFF